MKEEDDLIKRIEAAQEYVDSGKLDLIIVESKSGIRFAVTSRRNKE